jgi:hypothetical protein
MTADTPNPGDEPQVHPQNAAEPVDDAADLLAPTERSAPILLQVRPRKITILASIATALVVGSMVVIGVLLRNANLGVAFRVSDQLGLIGIGLILGAVIMTAARPRLRVDRNGLWVRNVLGDVFTPWALVTRIAYPAGSPWAQLQMPDDEVRSVMAIQAMDRGRAVRALERVRELQKQYGPPAPEPVRQPGPSADEIAEQSRPLGRLEIIDREKAAARDRDFLAKQQKQARKAARRQR